MLFNSLLFLFFFLIVTTGYYLLPHKFRWFWLLGASCYFYMYFKPEYILIIFFTIIVDFVAGILIENAKGAYRKIYLLASIITNVGVLAFYKYFNFFSQNINFLSQFLHGPKVPLLDFILPIGLSFHTFQAMSYTIEVYRGKQKAERHLGLYALYVMFYPQMVAGPIERPQHILPQLRRVISYNPKTFVAGLLLMAFGLFKKVVVADRLGLFVDPVFSNPRGHSAAELFVASYFFAFQIYCDFSGYSDIAIGAALTLGIELMRNFNMPYLSRNIAEFWQRWHISLSTWFKDYIYIPLGGNRVDFFRLCINFMIVFLVSGLWHGANWKYMIWGGIHGLLLVIYQLMKKMKLIIKGFTFFKWLLTFNLVCFAWVFFRADHVGDAFYIIEKITRVKEFSFRSISAMPAGELRYCTGLIILLLAADRYFQNVRFFSVPKIVMWTVSLVILCYFLGIFSEAQFIYFQF
ncbi:MBOAT family O-acyltransferase [Mucilaginibacter flavus]|uniref:MBOAT family O-acyltransferase n=1 Tax=Mucilaginibacter flavus TaxID=931504 RepID=UPI0025B4BFCD|nr:MBOAT family O-acyltransferase [Mucilaginibacter flavus]MDN3584412.1 MBOAT family O-acyltransferase [Mucilaginibacter flavus]